MRNSALNDHVADTQADVESGTFSVSLERPSTLANESDWQRYVMSVGRLFGWRVAHIYVSGDASDKGVPDLLLVRASRVIFAELKFYSTAAVADEQDAWLEELCEARDVESYVWHVGSWPEVLAVLSPHDRVLRLDDVRGAA